MATKKQKYYVVWHGHKPGIYTTWQTCSAQVKNFPNAVYKSFDSKAEAEDAFRHGYEKKKKPAPRKKVVPGHPFRDYIAESITVDAACSGNPGAMEYRGVWTSDHSEIFHVGPLRDGTNNIGEFLALVHALAMLDQKGDSSTPVYSDSRTAMAWLNRKKANTQLKRNAHNSALFDMIRRAEKWLQDHTWKNPVLKWETEHWGENPADFGRK